ncbi:hypothetical protein CAC42_4747 [Sphaceloma murrayae]|uniref:Uncharacterized protein n=1 Tax=Sphaceloma murrayae TaxID=2082308 RepID=A0A2K1QPI4_9PEZI|nr:hypothetical protein CAC42_4747 [Sphaceloma murrayae]
MERHTSYRIAGINPNATKEIEQIKSVFEYGLEAYNSLSDAGKEGINKRYATDEEAFKLALHGDEVIARFIDPKAKVLRAEDRKLFIHEIKARALPPAARLTDKGVHIMSLFINKARYAIEQHELSDFLTDMADIVTKIEGSADAIANSLVEEYNMGVVFFPEFKRKATTPTGSEAICEKLAIASSKLNRLVDLKGPDEHEQDVGTVLGKLPHLPKLAACHAAWRVQFRAKINVTMTSLAASMVEMQDQVFNMSGY